MQTCLTSTPCPSGSAQGVCPNGQNCIANTQCNDEDYLHWLREQQKANGNGMNQGLEAANHDNTPAVMPTTVNNNNVHTPVVSTPTPPVAVASIDKVSGSEGCSSNNDCNVGQFCNQPNPSEGGICGACLVNSSMGCATEQLCRTAGCHPSQDAGVTKCYSRSQLNTDCHIRLNDISAKCNVNTMLCEGGSGSGSTATTTEQQPSPEVVPLNPDQVDYTAVASPQQPQTNEPPPANTATTASSSIGIAKYYNPAGNEFFCGADYQQITEQCLNSKPCPGGRGLGFCEVDEACFSTPSCVTEYADYYSTPASDNDVQPSSNNVVQSTPSPTPPPTPLVVINPVPETPATTPLQLKPVESSTPATTPLQLTPVESSTEATVAVPQPELMTSNFCGASWYVC